MLPRIYARNGRQISMDPDSASGTSPCPDGRALSAGPHCHRYRRMVSRAGLPGCPARSGPNCTATDGSCIGYPYTDAVDYVPGDFVWMVAAFLLGPLVAAVIAALQYVCRDREPLLGRSG